MQRTKQVSRLPGGLACAAVAAVALAGGIGGCGFAPHVASGVVTCHDDDDCPQGMVCAADDGDRAGAPRLCCAPGLCPDEAPASGPGGTNGPSGTGGTPGSGDPAGASEDAGAPGANLDAGPAPLPPSDDPPDAAVVEASGGEVEGGAGAALAACSPRATQPYVAAAGEQVACVISARGNFVYLQINTTSGRDPLSLFGVGGCRADIGMERQVVGPTGGPSRPLAAESIGELVAVGAYYRELCLRVGGRMIGAEARDWARRAPNQAEIKSAFQRGTGLDLEVLSVEEESLYWYLGPARGRRGRIVMTMTAGSPWLAYWPRSAPRPTLYRIPIDPTADGDEFLGRGSFADYDEARRALRRRVRLAMMPLLTELKALVAGGELAPQVTDGPAAPLVPLAISGRLRTAAGIWDSPAAYEEKRAESKLSIGIYGWAYGIVLPAPVDEFFHSIDGPQFAQLRGREIRAAYADDLFVSTLLLDLLADEVGTTEFGYAWGNAADGYFLHKLLGPPP